MAGFAITSYLGATSLSAAPRKGQDIRRISYYDLVPSEDNFYSMDEIAALKASIELAGHVLHNLVVVPTAGDKYKILSGHRRHKAIGELLAEGKDEYEFIPCTVEQLADDEDGIREQTLLIAANSQREKTAWDKLEEVRRMREIARKAKARDGVSGRVRDLVAQSLHVSASKVAKYDSILNNLIPALLDEIKTDRLSISVAYELSTLPADQQQAQCDFFLEHGKLPARDVFRANTQQSEPQPSDPPRGDVFRANTQPDKPQPSDPPKGDVFRANTQQSEPQPSEQPKGDVFRANTQDTIARLQSLRAFCSQSSADHNTASLRDWMLDIGALDAAISALQE